MSIMSLSKCLRMEHKMDGRDVVGMDWHDDVWESLQDTLWTVHEMEDLSKLDKDSIAAVTGVHMMAIEGTEKFKVTVMGGIGFLFDYPNHFNITEEKDWTEEEAVEQMTEKQLQDKILKKIKDTKSGVYFKFHNGPYGARGVSDLVGTTRGIAVFIEVKSLTGRVTKLQEKFLRDTKAEGAISGVARSVEEAMGLVAQAKLIGASKGNP